MMRGIFVTLRFNSLPLAWSPFTARTAHHLSRIFTTYTPDIERLPAGELPPDQYVHSSSACENAPRPHAPQGARPDPAPSPPRTFIHQGEDFSLREDFLCVFDEK